MTADHYPAGEPAFPAGDDDRSWHGLWHTVQGIAYRPGWVFRLAVVPYGLSPVDLDGLPPLDEARARRLDMQRVNWAPIGPWGLPQAYVLLLVEALVDNSDPAGAPEIVSVHPFTAPPPGVTPWKRWIFDRLMDVERHEAGEIFRVHGARPFPPGHNHLLTYAVPGEAR